MKIQLGICAVTYITPASAPVLFLSPSGTAEHDAFPKDELLGRKHFNNVLNDSTTNHLSLHRFVVQFYGMNSWIPSLPH